MYGTVMPFLESVKTTGATAAPGRPAHPGPAAAYTGVNDPRRTRITVGTSQLGLPRLRGPRAGT